MPAIFIFSAAEDVWARTEENSLKLATWSAGRIWTVPGQVDPHCEKIDRPGAQLLPGGAHAAQVYPIGLSRCFRIVLRNLTPYLLCLVDHVSDP